jgi:futalosine hydrolase
MSNGLDSSIQGSSLEQLILVPTDFERQKLLAAYQRLPNSAEPPTIELCGFGPIAAAATTTRLLLTLQPSRLLLLGIAGVYSKFASQHPIGTALRFCTVHCDGIGAGSGDDFKSAATLGWHQWPREQSAPPIGDSISFDPVGPTTAELLTVCSAAGNPEDASRRSAAFPAAVAEDMEAYSVAAACQISGVPCDIVRGISNVAGDRDKANWDIDAAVEAVVSLTFG